jgi:hypothetical protein
MDDSREASYNKPRLLTVDRLKYRNRSRNRSQSPPEMSKRNRRDNLIKNSDHHIRPSDLANHNTAMECRHLIVEVNGDTARADRPTHLKKNGGPTGRSTGLLHLDTSMGLLHLVTSTGLLHLDTPVVPRLVTGRHLTTNIKILLGGHHRRDMVDLLAALTHLLLPDSNITSRRILLHTNNNNNPRWNVVNV